MAKNEAMVEPSVWGLGGRGLSKGQVEVRVRYRSDR